MIKDVFKERGEALENEFFRRVDEQLLANLKAKTTAKAARQKLEAATGLTDENLLDELMATGVTAESAAAISLVPFVLVAWADGKMDAKARVPIMKAAEKQGVASESPAAQLLEHWLLKKPKPELASTWKRYAKAVIEKLSQDGRIALRSEIIDGACAVAKATGGVLGFGRTSADERRVIAELDQVLEDNDTAIT